MVITLAEEHLSVYTRVGFGESKRKSRLILWDRAGEVVSRFRVSEDQQSQPGRKL